MKVVVTRSRGEFNVWAMLDDPSLNDDPVNRGESFIIGGGDTLAEAVAAAVTTLTNGIQQVMEAASVEKVMVLK